MKTKFIYFFLFITFLNRTIYTQEMNFLNSSRINQGARLSALADAFIADDFCPGIMFFNPAGLSYLKNFYLSVNHYQEKSINAYSQGIILPINIGVAEGIAFSINTLHTGYIKENNLSQIKFGQIAYNVAYSREILTNLSAGGILGFQYTKSNYNDLWTYRSSIGLYYVPTEEFSYSIVLGEMGKGFNYVLSDRETVLKSFNMPNGIQVGINMRHPLNLREYLFSIALSSEKIFNEKDVRYKTGFELNVFRFLSLRTGYSVSEYLKYATFGIGVKFYNFVIDAAYYPNKIANNELYLSLSYKIAK